jgi:hypothetical protein
MSTLVDEFESPRAPEEGVPLQNNRTGIWYPEKKIRWGSD